ncbi:52 kDa repressor of the inhibitor of the protein kinase-like [Uloborus diversus]|uniref:52 kDa repressor of the inhibitor of the protein kinase-like n=1 Tax=Uloborus diversus TaxID=327109 RepID=UPI0024095569|nr:52 kDa repressor of the inhibitor of the protein kinase-like [Uloborus diversus]
MSYKHKSGAEKKRLRAEKEKKSAIGRQEITNFFQSSACFSVQPLFSGTTELESNKPTTSAFEITEENSLGSEINESRGENVNQLDLTNNANLNDPEVQPVFSETTELESNEPITSAIEITQEDSLGSKFDENRSENISQLDSTSNANLSDPAEWPDFINDTLRSEIIKIGAPNFNKLSAVKFPRDLNKQQFQKKLLYSKSSNQREELQRDWLVWSSMNQALYCFPCFLFKNSISSKGNSSLAKKSGFSPAQVPWKKCYSRFPSHEESAGHKNCYVSWKSLEQSLAGKGIDSNIQTLIMCETERWKAILKRIIDVTLHLASRGLPFRGDNSHIGHVSNRNFLGCLELISHYDEITRDHLNKIKLEQERGESKKHTHYLSWQSQNEFISLCGDQVSKLILAEREKAIYYAIIADATPDVSHQEQNVLILRYLSFSSDKNLFEIQERFIEFLNFSKKTGFDIAQDLLNCLKKHAIPLEDFRGQVFDNGSNMKGAVKGVKSRILNENPLALFSPCGAHSLNLTGVNAAKMCPQIMTFFGSVQALFVLFAASPSRWSILLEEIPISLMALSETRWSSRIDAVRPISLHRPGLLKALDRLCDELQLTEKAFSEARALRKYFSSFESMLMSAFWLKVLSCIDEQNVIIQTRGISLDVELNLLNDIHKDLQKLRDGAEVEEEAMHQSTELLPGEYKFRTEVIFTVLDFIIIDINTRFEEMKEICSLFKPILKYMSLDDEEVQKLSACLSSKYAIDLNSQLGNEIIHIRNIHSSVFNEVTELSPLVLLNEIYNRKLQTIFPNICIALRIFCTLPLTVAQAERAFSKLGNRIKTWTRSAIGQDRLNSLAILGIEHQLAAQVDFNSVIHEFATKKLTGLWYEIEKYPKYFGARFMCVKVELTDYGDNVTINWTGVNERSGETVCLNGNATVPNEKDASKINVKYADRWFSENYWVLDTDYKKYSVVYSCFNFFHLCKAA